MKRVSKVLETNILRHRLIDSWPIGTIATQLGVHHSVVRRVLAQHGLPSPVTLHRSRLVDPYVEFIRDMFQKHPKLHASRLHQMACERGYRGSESHFRREAARYRPAKAPEPFLRLRTLKGEQAQVDWGSFGQVIVGQATRRLYAFVMTLSWSRMIWLHFYFDMQMSNFLSGHVGAFEFFGGVPRTLLFDNLKSAVIEREGHAIRFNDRTLELAAHYGFEIRAAAPYRGNEKGRVERSIRYIRDNFFAARTFHDIGRLNEEARKWCLDVSSRRKWPQDDRRRVQDAFEEERQHLRALPDDSFPIYARHEVKIGRTPWARFDKNDYSLPHKCVRKRLVVLADHQTLRFIDDDQEVVSHVRSYDRRASIENPAHTAALIAYKRNASKSSFNYRLLAAAPNADLFMVRAAQRGHNLGSLTAGLLTLLDVHGREELNVALADVNQQDLVRVTAVRMILEQRARAQGRPVPMPVRLPRAELAALHVRSPNLADYDALASSEDENEGELEPS